MPSRSHVLRVLYWGLCCCRLTDLPSKGKPCSLANDTPAFHPVEPLGVAAVGQNAMTSLRAALGIALQQQATLVGH